jgi:hypothetical protein
VKRTSEPNPRRNRDAGALVEAGIQKENAPQSRGASCVFDDVIS